MGMTFLNQLDKLARILGDANTSSDDQWPIADRKFEINRGEQMLAKRSRSLLRYTTGTVSSQAISLPTGFLGIHVLVVNDEIMSGLREMALQDHERMINSGEDRFFFWANSSGTRQINFIDSASDGLTYKLWYFIKPTTSLVSDSDESLFEDEYREGSVYYAASELLPQTGKLELAEYWKGRFNEVAEELRIRTEQLYLNSIRSYPDLGVSDGNDKDKQGFHNTGSLY